MALTTAVAYSKLILHDSWKAVSPHFNIARCLQRHNHVMPGVKLHVKRLLSQGVANQLHPKQNHRQLRSIENTNKPLYRVVGLAHSNLKEDAIAGVGCVVLEETNVAAYSPFKRLFELKYPTTQHMTLTTTDVKM
jgi:hypothetical protein